MNTALDEIRELRARLERLEGHAAEAAFGRHVNEQMRRARGLVVTPGQRPDEASGHMNRLIRQAAGRIAPEEEKP